MPLIIKIILIKIIWVIEANSIQLIELASKLIKLNYLLNLIS